MPRCARSANAGPFHRPRALAGRRRQIGLTARVPRFVNQAFELCGVELEGLKMQDVAGLSSLDAFGTEDLPETRDVGLEHVAGGVGRFLTPDQVDECIHRDDLVRADDQMREDDALLGPAELDRPVVPRASRGPRTWKRMPGPYASRVRRERLLTRPVLMARSLGATA